MTLLELVLVLSILVILVGIAAPTFEAMVSSRKLREAIDLLKNELAEARVTAMRTGQAQVMQCTLSGQSYSIVPWMSGSESQDASAGATVTTQGGLTVETEATTGGVATSPVDTSDSVKKLDSEVLFLAVDTLVDSRNALAIQQSTGTVPVAGTTTSTPGSTSSPILVYPDGSTTTAQIVLADKRGRRMAIQIRGVTGKINSLRLTAVDPNTISSVE